MFMLLIFFSFLSSELPKNEKNTKEEDERKEIESTYEIKEESINNKILKRTFTCSTNDTFELNYIDSFELDNWINNSIINQKYLYLYNERIEGTINICKKTKEDVSTVYENKNLSIEIECSYENKKVYIEINYK